MSAKLNVVIVGGGQGGANLIQALMPKLDRSKHNLILIDKRPVGVHMMATARLAVTSEGNLNHEALLPFDRIFSKGFGEYVEGKVSLIEKNGPTGGDVVLENGKRIPFTVLVLATGSIWDGTSNIPDGSTEEIQNFVKTNQARIQNANNIVIAGGGAVGLELAGEIRDVYPANKKNITVVQASDQLLNDTYPPKYRKSVEEAFKARDINIVFKEFIDETVPSPDTHTITTRSGKSIDADLVLFARGPKPNTAFISSSLGESTLDERGYVKLKRTLQLVSHPDIFAIGDITEFKEQKQAMKAQAHAGVAATNVLAYLNGQPLKEYKGFMEMIVLTNGKNGGRAFLPLLWGITLGDWFARLVKAKTVLVPQYKKFMGY